MYVDKGDNTEKIKIPKSFLAGIVICVVAVIVLGVYPQLVFDFCETAAAALL